MRHPLLITSLSLIFFLGCGQSTDSGSIEDAVGKDAPGFSYTSLSGQQVSLSQYQGKVVYLFFYGAGCPHCRGNGPVTESQINQVFNEDSNFVALGLDTWNQSVSSNTSFKATTGITYTLLLNAEQSLIDYYGNTTSYDRSVVIDANGKIAYQGSGFVSTDVDRVAEVIEQKLNEL